MSIAGYLAKNLRTETVVVRQVSDAVRVAVSVEDSDGVLRRPTRDIGDVVSATAEHVL